SVQLAVTGPLSVIAGTPVAIGVNASDSDGIVTQVQLFSNGALVATQANPQPGASLTFTPTTAGRFNVYAAATDDTGNTAVSPSIVLNVASNTAPIVALVRPADDATTTNTNTPVFLEATASDVDVGQTLTVTFVNNATGATLATGTVV